MNFIQRFFGVFFSPAKVMEDLDRKPRILFPLILNIVSSIAMMFAVLPMVLEQSRSAMEIANPDMTPEQIDQILNMTKLGIPFGAAFMVLITWFIGALVIWGIVKLLKGEGTYKQILSVTGYASVITLLSAIIVVITTNITGVYSQLSVTSLANLLPEMKGNFFYGVAKTLDVINIWYFSVIAIGIVAVSKLSKKKIYIIALCLFAIFAIYSGIQELRVDALM